MVKVMMMNEKRRRVHIKERATTEDPRTFLDERSMRRLKWEECVVRAMAKREGITAATFVVGHYTCSCGSYECLATAVDRTPRRRVNRNGRKG